MSVTLVLKGDLEDPADAIFRQAFRFQMFVNNPHRYDLSYRAEDDFIEQSLRG